MAATDGVVRTEKLEEVIEITKRYACPICKTIYDWEEDARECFEKGIIGDGSEIEPGLLAKLSKSNFDFLIFTGEELKEHHRGDNFIKIYHKFKIGLFPPKLKRGYGLNRGGYTENWLPRNPLDADIKNDRIRLLDENEFEKAKNIINIFNLSKLYLDEKAKSAFNNLYRYHELFDRK